METKEVGLFIIKPDGRDLQEEEFVNPIIKSLGLEIINRREIVFSEEQLKEFYSDKQDERSKDFFPYLGFRSSILLIIEGEETNNKLIGVKRLTRKTFNHDNFYTGTHCSDNEIQALEELKILDIDYAKVRINLPAIQ